MPSWPIGGPARHEKTSATIGTLTKKDGKYDGKIQTLGLSVVILSNTTPAEMNPAAGTSSENSTREQSGKKPQDPATRNTSR